MLPQLRHAIGILAVMLGGAGAQADTIRLGTVLPLTGHAAPIGLRQMHGIRFAVDKANAAGGVGGNKIEVLLEDSQAKAERSIQSFNKLVDQQNVPVVFGSCPGPLLAMAPLASRKKVLLVNAGAQADALATASPYLVNTLPMIGDELKVLSQYLIGDGKKRAVILFENADAGIAGRDDFEKYFPEAGGTILSLEPARFGQVDYRPALLKLSAAGPDVMLVSLTTGVRKMAQQYKRLGLNFTVAGTTFLGEPDTVADPSAEGFVHTQVHIDVPAELAAEFKAKSGVEMDFPARQYYNATLVVLAVVDRLLTEGKKLTGESVHDMLFTIRTFRGLVPLAFNTNTASVPLDINVISGGKDVTIQHATAN